ncbi:hypothetical protein B0H13DRAFT_2401379 [Mycena leptocephala]|nr:hypothetical protein B0H13DRAFT_2401379 [Mycena leptocephala]
MSTAVPFIVRLEMLFVNSLLGRITSAPSQAGYDITKRLGVALYPPVLRMLNQSSVDNSSPKATATTSSRMSSVNLRLRTSSPTASPLRVVHCHHTLPSPSVRPISIHIHVRFDYLTVPTSLSRWPSPPRSWIYLADRSVHRVMGAVQSRRLPLIYHQSYIPARALVACGPTTPASFRRRRRSARYAHGGRFFGLAPLPSLFAFVGVRLPWRKRKSFRPPHAREGAQRDPFTSMKQLRPLPPRTSASRARTSCISCACRRWWMEREKHADGDRMTIWMKTEKRADGMGIQTLSLRFDTLSRSAHPPSPSLSLSPSFPPSPTPSPPPYSSSPSRLPLSPAVWYGTRWLRAAVVPVRTRVLAAMEKHGCGYGYGASTSSPLHRAPSSWAVGADIDTEVGVYACAYTMPSCWSSSDRGGVSMDTRAGVAVCFLRGYKGRAFRRSGYNFVWMRTRASLEVGMEMETSRGFLFKLGRIPVLCTFLCMPGLPFPIHIRTATALNETSS